MLVDTLGKGRSMPTLNIFVSFEFGKDHDLQNNFYIQAEKHTQHRILDCSLHESYPDEEWKNKARAAIRPCDVVVVLIGQDTHNAQGVVVETNTACSFGKPIIQIRPRHRPYNGLTRLEEPIPWRWPTINAKLDDIASERR